MPRTDPGLVTNPVRQIRRENNKTIKEFAAAANVHWQALYHQECGCYPKILPGLLSYLKKLGYREGNLVSDYEVFIHKTRQRFVENYMIALPDVIATENPITTWRNSLGLTKAALCKELCIQHSQLNYLESGKALALPTQIEKAFKVIGFSKDEIDELNYRVAEYHVRVS